jgi:uncharacterized tellurite resistance protein B-like protein
MRTILRDLVNKLSKGSVVEAGIDGENAVHMATALLLVEVGQADFEWDETEIKLIIERLVTRFGLSATEAGTLFDDARARSHSEVSLHPTLRAINESCDKDQKRMILEDCWRVAYADGKIDRYEEHHIRRIAELLYLPHGDFIRAKLCAAEEVG